MRPSTCTALIVVVAACSRGTAPRPDSTATVAAATPAPPPAAPSTRWCDQLPRPANAKLEHVKVSSDWFEVYRVTDGVFAIVEPYQFQEAISYLIVGANRALMFDTGIGLVRIRPIVDQLTQLPVMVLNSHTHYDHVGGNTEFDRIYAIDTPYTRANMHGFGHAELAGEVAPESFCKGVPAGADTAQFRTRAWTPSRLIGDGDTLDLGGRVVEVIQVPGHTPDAVALYDRANRLLWTGDSYYDGWVWLYVPETDLDAYERSIAKLRALSPAPIKLLPAHNGAVADPERLGQVADAIRQVRSGAVTGTEQGNNRIVFQFDGFGILTSKQLLDGKRGDPTRAGSGLTTWP